MSDSHLSALYLRLGVVVYALGRGGDVEWIDKPGSGGCEGAMVGVVHEHRGVGPGGGVGVA